MRVSLLDSLFAKAVFILTERQLIADVVPSSYVSSSLIWRPPATQSPAVSSGAGQEVLVVLPAKLGTAKRV